MRSQLSTQTAVNLWNSAAKALRMRRPVPHAKPACTSRRNLSWSTASAKCRSHAPAALSMPWKAQTPSRRTLNTSPSSSASCFTKPMDPSPHMAPSPKVSTRRVRRVALVIPKLASQVCTNWVRRAALWKRNDDSPPPAGVVSPTADESPSTAGHPSACQTNLPSGSVSTCTMTKRLTPPTVTMSMMRVRSDAKPVAGTNA